MPPDFAERPGSGSGCVSRAFPEVKNRKTLSFIPGDVAPKQPWKSHIYISYNINILIYLSLAVWDLTPTGCDVTKGTTAMVREELWNKNNQQWGYKFRGLPLLCIVMWCNVVNLIINNPQQRGSWYFFVGVTMVYNINTPYPRRSIGTRCLAWLVFQGTVFHRKSMGFPNVFPMKSWDVVLPSTNRAMFES